jgi:DNA-binding MarR family transcriptional regulator/GNAT superfamily N-acetyltransferase
MAPLHARPSTEDVAAVRRFNRFYTARLRLLEEQVLGTPFSLGEARILFEIATRDNPTASELCSELNLDPGYVSRVVSGFRKSGYVSRTAAADDRRQGRLALTAAGKRAFTPLDRQASARMRRMLGGLDPAVRAEVVIAMDTVRSALESESESVSEPRVESEPEKKTEATTLTFREPRPGDLGWIVQRHGELYASEWNYDDRFEALVATIVGEYVAKRVPEREQCWIAELDGERAGSVFLVRKTDETAKLRLLLVEPTARGHGIGAKLVRLCTDFARSAGYREITLWTQSELVAARAIYVREGYVLVDSKPHEDFGKPCVAETWTLKL